MKRCALTSCRQPISCMRRKDSLYCSAACGDRARHVRWLLRMGGSPSPPHQPPFRDIPTARIEQILAGLDAKKRRLRQGRGW